MEKNCVRLMTKHHSRGWAPHFSGKRDPEWTICTRTVPSIPLCKTKGKGKRIAAGGTPDWMNVRDCESGAGGGLENLSPSLVNACTGDLYNSTYRHNYRQSKPATHLRFQLKTVGVVPVQGHDGHRKVSTLQPDGEGHR